MTLGAGFRVCGIVVRKFVPASGACAFLTLEVPTDRGSKTKLEFVTFDQVVEVGSLSDGSTCQVTGTISSKAVKDKSKNDVQVDGRTLWVPQLVIKAVTVEGVQKRPPVARDAQPPATDDDVNF